MTVEEKHMGEEEAVVVDQTLKVVDEKCQPKTVEKCSSFKEESNFLSDLKDFERKALNELKSKLEDAILTNSLFELKKKETQKDEKTEEPIEEKKSEGGEEEKKSEGGEEEKTEEPKEEKKSEACEEEKTEETKEEEEIVDKEISIWGVPLLPSKCSEGTDVILLKFLRARDFKVTDAFQMLKKTLEWRKQIGIDSILEQDFDADLNSAAYMNGVDREGHPVCYNIHGKFTDEELYNKTFGTEENREVFLKWRVGLMEKGISKLALKPGGVTSLLQINDHKNAPGISRKEIRVAMKQAVVALQDNYPEFVARHIFINAPFWFYALNALLSPLLTQRTKSKFVVARPGKVTETLFKYIEAQEVPIEYGGFKRDNDFEFSTEDGSVSETNLKAGSTQTIEIAANETGGTLVWDVTVLGGEVNYKEEFVPSDDGSYTVVIQKGKKMDGPIRNSYRNNEPGKVILTVQNSSNKKKKVLFRYKTKKTSSAF